MFSGVAGMRFFKLGPGLLAAAVALFLVVAFNGALWGHLLRIVKPQAPVDWLLLASFFAFQTATYFLVLRVLSFPYVLKPVAAILIVLAAVTSHFMAEYGAVIDVNMIRNALQTNPAEARDLTSWGAVVHVLGYGVLPAAGVLIMRLNWPAWRPLLRQNLAGATAALALVGSNVAIFSGAYFSILREQREVELSFTPANVVMAVGKLGIRNMREYSGPVSPLGSDARIEPDPPANGRPRVTVVVVGETARADNFSLLGYGRETNPELKKISNLVAFPHVSSCGTDTAHSVPCMFSGLGREKYSYRAFQRSENLLDVLKHAGLDVIWVDNQDGCKGVCARTPTITTTNAKDPRFCASGECHDEILLDGLPERIATMQKGGVIVLHMMGSHGPAYYKRVPQQFTRFKPICETSQFSRCTSEEIVNSYDNTILYTDYVLARLVDVLRQSSQTGVDTMMLYVSDHGESLGENGVYLHAMPYFIAPRQQTHVPMVIWQSGGSQESLGMSPKCLRDIAVEGQFSHDHLFHTVLGAHDISTSVYDSGLDLLRPCRKDGVR
jgi:lipid A ethanolaminephosphotransferase